LLSGNRKLDLHRKIISGRDNSASGDVKRGNSVYKGGRAESLDKSGRIRESKAGCKRKRTNREDVSTTTKQRRTSDGDVRCKLSDVAYENAERREQQNPHKK